MKPIALIFILTSAALRADDWPQFRGPLRDNVSRETGLLKSWPEGGPKRLWLSTNLGAGYSGPAIVGEKIFIMGQRNDAQWLLCLDAKSGKELWATRLGGIYHNEFGDGPRGTPTAINFKNKINKYYYVHATIKKSKHLNLVIVEITK